MVSRRTFAAASLALLATARPSRAAGREMRQFHNQPADSPLHRRLTEMWTAVEKETDGRVRVTVLPLNNKLPGSDPQALQMLRSGELEFYTLMGGILGEVVPVADAQGLPFVFRDNTAVYAAVDGALGRLLQRECATKGMYAIQGGCFENGFRHITCSLRPISNVADLQGLKMRTPNSAMFTDAFKSLGCEPVIMNVVDLYEGLQSGRAQAQENPLIIAESFKLYEVQRYVSLTSHMWSGFNLLANLDHWNALRERDRAIIERNAAKYVRLQRADNTRINGELESGLKQRGMIFNRVDTGSFRAPLADFYQRWKAHVGSEAWAILERQAGRLTIGR